MTRIRVRAVIAGLMAAGLAMTSCAAPAGTRVVRAAGPAVAATCSPGGGTQSAGPPAAAAVPAALRFTARTLDGREFRGASLAGRPVIFWFWAPWCATCAGQAPSVVELAARFGDRVAFIGVAGLGEVSAMNDFVDEFELGKVDQIEDVAGAVWRRFRVTEQSTYVILDRDGRAVHRGWLDSADVEQRLAVLAG